MFLNPVGLRDGPTSGTQHRDRSTRDPLRDRSISKGDSSPTAPRQLTPEARTAIQQVVIMPVNVSESTSPVIIRNQQAGPALVVGALISVFSTLAAAAAVVGGLDLSNSVLNADIINLLSERASSAFLTQNSINNHLAVGLLQLNQQVSLIQEEIDLLPLTAHIPCMPTYAFTCVTPAVVSNYSSQVHSLNDYLRGPWNQTFLNFTVQLANQILTINNTRASIYNPDEALSWLSKAWGLVKSLGGAVSLLSLIFLCLRVIFVILWHQWNRRKNLRVALTCALFPITIFSGPQCLDKYCPRPLVGQ
ncbi:uncharacterized protein LOC129146044 [Talpa occidentalis]|uniref:uncharacterized protein LOC129146044 n=1 Tax=Talpa occidentalis TaxID=50954 RepID=UPI0023F9190F|nr:uncharacterized protein LOC129146044 [Talpa occidentalis]